MFELFNSSVCTIQPCVFALFSLCVWTVQCVRTIQSCVFALFIPVCLHYSVCVFALFNVSALFSLCVCTTQSVCLHYTVLCICTISLYVFELFSPECLHYSVRCVCTMLFGKYVTHRQHYKQAVYLPGFRSSDPREKEGQQKEDNEMCRIARHEQPAPSIHN